MRKRSDIYIENESRWSDTRQDMTEPADLVVAVGSPPPTGPPAAPCPARPQPSCCWASGWADHLMVVLGWIAHQLAALPTLRSHSLSRLASRPPHAGQISSKRFEQFETNRRETTAAYAQLPQENNLKTGTIYSPASGHEPGNERGLTLTFSGDPHVN